MASLEENLLKMTRPDLSCSLGSTRDERRALEGPRGAEVRSGLDTEGLACFGIAGSVISGSVFAVERTEDRGRTMQFGRGDEGAGLG